MIWRRWVTESSSSAPQANSDHLHRRLSNTRMRPPQSGFVQVGLWEVCRTGTDNALGRETAPVSNGPSNPPRDRSRNSSTGVDRAQQVADARCRWTRLGPNLLFTIA